MTSQSLLQEVAFLLREYYDNHGQKLEKFSTEIINLVAKQYSTNTSSSLKRINMVKELVEGEEYLIIELPDPLVFSTVVKWDIFELKEAKPASFLNPLNFQILNTIPGQFQVKYTNEYTFTKVDQNGQALYDKKLVLSDSILSSSIEIYKVVL